MLMMIAALGLVLDVASGKAHRLRFLFTRRVDHWWCSAGCHQDLFTPSLFFPGGTPNIAADTPRLVLVTLAALIASLPWRIVDCASWPLSRSGVQAQVDCLASSVEAKTHFLAADHQLVL